MAASINLIEAERRAVRATFEDGLLDISIGSMMVGSGLRGLTDSLWYYLIVLGGILFMLIGKRFITAPRMGQVRFGPERRAKHRKVRLVVWSAVAVTWALALLSMLGRAPAGGLVPPVLVMGVTAVFMLIAYYTGFERMYLYGLLMGIYMTLAETSGHPVGPVAGVVAGGVALYIGAVVLARFVGAYPIPVEEVSTEEAFAEEVPTEEVSTGEVSAEGASTEEASAGEVPSDS